MFPQYTSVKFNGISIGIGLYCFNEIVQLLLYSVLTVVPVVVVPVSKTNKSNQNQHYSKADICGLWSVDSTEKLSFKSIDRF